MQRKTIKNYLNRFLEIETMNNHNFVKNMNHLKIRLNKMILWINYMRVQMIKFNLYRILKPYQIVYGNMLAEISNPNIQIKIRLRNKMIIHYLMNLNQYNYRILNKLYNPIVNRMMNHNQMINLNLDRHKY